jgi:hypothetical protein
LAGKVAKALRAQLAFKFLFFRIQIFRKAVGLHTCGMDVRKGNKLKQKLPAFFKTEIAN